MRRIPLAAVVLALLPLTPLAAQTREDSLAIRATAEDYLIGWYDGDAARMERAVHPDLAKRQVSTMENGRSRFSNMGAMALVQVTRGRSSSPQAADQRLLEVDMLEVLPTMAMVKIVSWDFIDLVSMAKSNGRWVIVNDLWDGRPR